ncbi:MAG: hypothetical protein K2R93_09965 [Gemmatimonadaceae bacterium]|nr:hypothetical protein [Gemmatimonadaceae bacterium]
MSTRQRVLRMALRSVLTTPAWSGALHAQGTAKPAPSPAAGAPGRLSGSLLMSNELYGASGITPRRPGSTWRMQAAPSLRLFGATSVGVDLLVSNEGAEFRQRLPQLGLEPHFAWGTVHLGDFSKDYGAYTLQGLRLRGAGIDLTRGVLRASVQGGVSQNAIQTAVGGPVYQRSVVAGTIGLGSVGQRSLDLTVVRALDALRPDDRPGIDTLGLDTLPADLRPQAFTRPQSNLVASLGGTLALLGQALQLKGEVAGALLTRDRTSPLIQRDSVSGGGLLGSSIAEVRLSSNADLAWNAEAQYRAPQFGVRAGMEQVGAGYGSLGVAYLINDRRAWFAGGDVRLLGDHLQLQGRVQQQADNLLGQKRFTTMRDVYTAGVMVRARRASLALTGVHNLAQNDAANDTLLVNNAASVLTAQASVPITVAGKELVFTSGGSWQQNEDANPVRAIPAITVRTWSAGVVVPVGMFSLSPSVNGVSSDGGGTAAQNNVTGGFRASARLGKGKGTFSAGYNRTFVAAREVSGATAQVMLPIFWATRLNLNARLQRYGALGVRRAFRESFLTTSVSRSF